MAQNIVELGFNIEELTAEKKQVLDLMVDLFGKLREYDGTKFNPLGSGGLGDLRKSIQDGAKAMGEFESMAAKYNKTVTEQAEKQRAAKKATDDLGASQKESAEAADTYSTSQDRLRRQAAENKVAQEQLAASLRTLKDDYAKGLITAEEYTKSLNPLLAQQLALKVANADVTKTLTVLEKQFQNVGGSTAQLESRLKELQGVYDKLSPEGRNADAGKTLLKEIQDVDAAFKALKGDTGRFQDNVGNYSGAFKDAFKVLKDQLTAVKSQMGEVETKAKNLTGNPIGFDRNRFKGDVTNFVKTGTGNAGIGAADAAVYQELINKEKVLESNLERLQIGFKTTRQESRAFAEAASQVGLALGLESEEFQTFDKAVGHTQNAINDIKAASKFQAQDAKLIVGLANAAQTLAGGFGAATAAASLFAGEDDNLQKQMAKFQELLVLINGLQAVANGLQAESGGVQLLLSARTNLLNAAKATQLLLTTRAIQVIEAETAATVVNAEVKEASVIVTGEQAAAEGVQTVAVAANTEATVANTAAQTAAKGAGLSTIAIAATIAVVAIGAGVALALLTAKLFGYKGAAGLTTDQQKELAKATGDLNEALNAQAKVFDDLDASQKRYYTNLISNAQDAGASQYALLLAQQRFDQSQVDAAKLEIDRLGATDAAYSKQSQRVQELLGLQQLANEEVKKISAIPEKDQTSSQKKALEADLKLLDVYSAQLGPEQKKFDDMRAAREKLAETTQKVVSDGTKFNKLSLDEQLDVAEKAEELRANLVKARNAIILSSDASTLSQRIAAIKSNSKQENDILDAQIAKVKNNPSNLINGLLTPEAQQQVDAANEKRRENLIKELDDERKIRRTYYERGRDANLSATKTQLEDQIKAAQELQEGKINNPNPFAKAPKVDLSDRLHALSDEYSARRDLLNAELKVELDKEGQTAEEKKAIYEKYGSDIAQLGRDFRTTYINLEKQAQEESLREWDLYYEKRKNQVTQNETEQIVLLNDLSDKKVITDREYARRRKQIEDEAALAALQTEVANSYLRLNVTKSGTKERADAEADLTSKVKDLSDKRKKQQDDNDDATYQKTINTLEETQLAYSNTVQGIGDILEIGYANQKSNLEKLEAQQQKAYESDVSRINSSTISEQEKSAQLLILDKQRQVQKEIDDRKSRQIDLERARFEKAASIASIALSTSEAIVKFLHEPGGFAGVALSVSAGIIGAAQIAKAIATPLPKYKLGAGIPGQPEHPGGLAWVGDDYKRELIKEEGKSPYWSPATPTLLNLKPKTQVMPLSYISEMIHEGMFVNQHGILAAAPIDNTQDLRDIKNTLIWHAGVMKESVKANRPIVIVKNNIGREIAHQAFIRKNVTD